jgi:hypothetical protein
MKAVNKIVSIFTLAILVHAVGQILGFLESWQISELITGADYRGALGIVGASDVIVKGIGLLFVVTTAGFLVVMYSFYKALQWWRPAGTAMAVLSVVLFGLWWESIPTLNLAGSLAFNIVLLSAAYLWPRPATSHMSSKM